MFVVHHVAIGSVDCIEIRLLPHNSHPHIVFPCAVELRDDGSIGYSRDECILLCVVVIEID